MSSVLKRNRTLARTEFISRAREVRTEVTKFVMNEKNIPKRYRFVYAVPMINLCRELSTNANTYYNCLMEGNNFKDEDFTFLYERKRLALYNMLDLCDNLLEELQSAMTHLYLKMSFREKVVGKIVDEKQLIIDTIDYEEENYINF